MRRSGEREEGIEEQRGVRSKEREREREKRLSWLRVHNCRDYGCVSSARLGAYTHSAALDAADPGACNGAAAPTQRKRWQPRNGADRCAASLSGALLSEEHHPCCSLTRVHLI